MVLSSLLLASVGGGLAMTLLAWPVWAASGAGVLAAGLALAWHRDQELRARRSAMELAPFGALLLGADRRPIWQSGAQATLLGGADGAPLERRLKHALWSLPTPAREATLNDQIAASLRGDGRPETLPKPDGGMMRVRHHALPGGKRLCFSADAPAAFEGEPPGPAVRDLLQSAPIGIWQLDSAGRTRFANERLLRLFDGIPPESLSASGLRRQGAPPDDGTLRLMPGEECEAVLRLPNGRELRLLVAAWPAAAAGQAGGGQLLSLLDLTPLKAAQARVEHLAEHDPLTGLPNRASFHAGLAAMVASPRGGLLMMVDLDHFKSANERFGHAAGDALLREAASRLRDVVRPSDLISRLGADEFAILAFDAGRETALSLAGRVRQALRPAVRVGGVELSVSASIGIAAAPEHGEEPEVLLRAADLAMREAKAMGRDKVSLFEPSLRERSDQRAVLREAFAEALKNGELELHVQPQQDLDRQCLAGAEALIRWRSSRLGRWVSPAEILPAAGEGGLMPELDRFVLRRAVALLAAWEGNPNAPACLAINISVSTLQDPLFATEVEETLLAAGVPPERLEIEIPEDLAIRDLPGVQRTLQALREVGVPLSLDDFGGGHSGLPHVVRLPVQRLKLDRSIVGALPDDPKAYAVLRATMALARGMGIEVVGEGVETEAQAFALRRAGCHIIQGWLIARPMAPEQLVPPSRAPELRATA
ncbi:MAG: sensor domain-containing phosphodiesterase [Rubritepida sp.]|nr:sensor domain-containing phosphodiesterase [Rubritepida sp.]